MKRVVFLLVALVLVFSAMPVWADNGAPNGAHYNLNIIGVPKTKTADMTGDNGHRIFVPEDGGAKIMLAEGPQDIFDFQVLDANGTKGVAQFQLPNPDPDGDGTTWYSVYVRALGKPGGKATMQSCIEDTTGTWCAVDIAGGVQPIALERTNGASKFVNVSKDLLYVDVCLAVDAITGECTETVVEPLFGEDGASYWWQYDNSGLKLAQFRFYEVETPAWALNQ